VGVGGGQWVAWGTLVVVVVIWCGGYGGFGLGFWSFRLGWKSIRELITCVLTKLVKSTTYACLFLLFFLNILNMFSNLNFHNNCDILIIDIDQLFNQAQKLSDGLNDLKETDLQR